MKTKLINHPQYLLLVDLEAKIKEGDWYYYNGTIRKHVAPKGYSTDLFSKVIAHLPKLNAPKLEGVDLLPDLYMSEQEWVSDEEIESKAEKTYQTTSMSNQIHRENMEIDRQIFIDGAKWMRDKLLNKSNQQTMTTTEKRELLIAFQQHYNLTAYEVIKTSAIDSFLSTLPDNGEMSDESSEDNCWLGDGTKNIEK